MLEKYPWFHIQFYELFFTLFIRWNERKKAGCIRGVSYREMWWQWYYEAAQSLLTFDSRNDVSFLRRQNWSNSGPFLGWLFRDCFRLQIWRRKFTLNLNDRIHSNGDNSVMVDRGKTSAFKFILQPCNWFQPDSTSFNQIAIFALGASNNSTQLHPATIIGQFGLQCGTPISAANCDWVQLLDWTRLNRRELETTTTNENQWKPLKMDIILKLWPNLWVYDCF